MDKVVGTNASTIVAFVAACLGLGSLSDASAQQDARTLRVIYPFAAGNSGDAICRLVTERLGAQLGRSAIVENRTGASGRIGTRAVINASPDGSTLLCTPMAPIVLHAVTHASLGYEPFDDLAPISQIATFDIGLIVGPGSPAKTTAELVAWVKANPDKGAYGAPGLGGLPHFFAVMFATKAGIPMRAVPYAGTGALMNDLVAGQVPMAVAPSADMSELHKSGKVRILALSARKPAPQLPDVPTFVAAGYDISGEAWYGFYAPAKTGAETIARQSEAIQAIIREGDIRKRFEHLGYVPTGTSSEHLTRQQRADRSMWQPVIQASGFKPKD